MTSSKLFERSLKVSPGGVHSPVRAFKGVGGPPVFIESAQGAYLKDVEGNRYLDYCMSWGPLILGHQDPEVKEEVRTALERGWSFGTAEPYSLELAELITSHIPAVEKIRFVNSGTEAVMSALRLARAVTGREKVVKFEGCYHGHVDSMLVKAGSGLAEMASPDSAGVSKTDAQNTLVLPLDEIQKAKELFEIHGKNIAALIIEPLPANNGLLIQRKEFLVELSKLCKAHGSLLIFDEVISGFRIGFGGMAEELQIQPDLISYGKVIGGGFPVGAYGGKSSIMDLVAPSGPVYQAGTLSANPIAMCAGLATLKKLLRESPYRYLQEETERFSREIEKIDSSLSVQNHGSLFWILLGNPEKKTIRNPSQIPEFHRQNFSKIFHALLKKGFYLAPSAFEVGFLSTAHSKKENDRLLEALKEALHKVFKS